jgi:RHS repeat-associated protein
VNDAKAVNYNLQSGNDYFPYGKILRSYQNGEQDKFLFTSKERDVENGLDYFGARMFDSDISRFLSLDPLQAKCFAYSPYNYVVGNPVLFHDPNGKGVEISPVYTTVQRNGQDYQKLTGINVTGSFYVTGSNAQEAVDLIKSDVAN